MFIFAREIAGIAQLVEHDLAKVGVAGSSPVSRSNGGVSIVHHLPPDKSGVLLLSRGGESYSIVYQNFPLLFKGGVSTAIWRMKGWLKTLLRQPHYLRCHGNPGSSISSRESVPSQPKCCSRYRARYF